MPAALAGLRICDLSGQLAGAGATRTLAAFGAEVIRIEDPVRKGKWDLLRGVPPFKALASISARASISAQACSTSSRASRCARSGRRREAPTERLMPRITRHNLLFSAMSPLSLVERAPSAHRPKRLQAFVPSSWRPHDAPICQKRVFHRECPPAGATSCCPTPGATL